MKRVVVFPPSGCSSPSVSKGFALEDTETLEGLTGRLSRHFGCPGARGVAVERRDGTRVEVADVKFIR